jgi:multicomponent Na+:H+ antiporter subunit B
VIFAAGLILFGLIYGLDALQQVAAPQWIERGIALGVLLYGGVGFLCLFNGGQFLDYSTLDTHDPTHGQHLGLLLVELGVGITVTCTLTAIFYAFAGRGRRGRNA